MAKNRRIEFVRQIMGVNPYFVFFRGFEEFPGPLVVRSKPDDAVVRHHGIGGPGPDDLSALVDLDFGAGEAAPVIASVGLHGRFFPRWETRKASEGQLVGAGC